MRAIYISSLLLALLVAPVPAVAQETQPGAACGAGEQHYIRLTGGPETPGTADILHCDGATWQSQIRFSSSGVGIGTTSPQAELQVSSQDDTEIRIEATGGVLSSRKVGIAFSHANGIGAAIVARRPVSQQDGMNLTFWTQPTAGGDPIEHMRIERDGNVGIGSTNPQSTLHVPDGKYAQLEDNNAGPPPNGDCNDNLEIGRFSIDTTNNRLYVCNGATRGWDYVTLTN